MKNTRISAIAAQAGLVATTMIDDSNRDIECYTDTSDGVPSIATIHNFAELLIKECIEALRLVPYNSDREFGDEDIYQDAIRTTFWS